MGRLSAWTDTQTSRSILAQLLGMGTLPLDLTARLAAIPNGSSRPEDWKMPVEVRPSLAASLGTYTDPQDYTADVSRSLPLNGIDTRRNTVSIYRILKPAIVLLLPRRPCDMYLNAGCTAHSNSEYLYN
jgi:hypothetical protein